MAAIVAVSIGAPETGEIGTLMSSRHREDSRSTGTRRS
jgi:hypothetical protein